LFSYFDFSQLILKHNAHAHCTNIVEVADGMDFFYQNKSHALKMLDFVSSVLPVRNRGASEKLISADTKSATANVQMTYAPCALSKPPRDASCRYHAELAPVCKDDLICLPRKTAIAMGNFGPLVLCLQVRSSRRSAEAIARLLAVLHAVCLTILSILLGYIPNEANLSPNPAIS
jgi:nonsense-mediated mRNA decay protein 3